MRKKIFEVQGDLDVTTYPWADTFTEKIWQSFWTPTKFSFAADVQQYHTEMTEQERGVVVRALSAISQVEVAVKTFWARLGDNLPHPELRDLGAALGNCETVHNKAYKKLLDVLGITGQFRENLGVPVFADRLKYLTAHLPKSTSHRDYLRAVILFTLFVENVSLFGQFYTVLWFNRNKAVLKDAAQQIQYTRNEEMLHAQVGIQVVRTIREEYPELFDAALEAEVEEAVHMALAAEAKITRWILGDVREDSLTPEVLDAFIASQMDAGLSAMGFQPVGGPRDPSVAEKYRWMEEEMYGNNLSDFFHKEPVEYTKNNRAYDEDLF